MRLDICEYTIAENAAPWPQRFGCVWEPSYRNGSGRVLAPVRVAGSWTIAESGEPIWNSRFMQLWNLRLSDDGRRLAAVAAGAFGSTASGSFAQLGHLPVSISERAVIAPAAARSSWRARASTRT